MAVVPAFPGCYSQGDTPEETIDNAREAIELTIEDMLSNGEAIPDPNAEIHFRVAVGQ